MSKPIKRHLRVGGAPEDDESELVVRMHQDDLPKGIRWNSYIHLRAKATTITCRVRNNDLAEIPHPRVHQVNINRSLRGLLGIKSGAVYDFYVTKAPFWKAPSYVMQYHPSSTARRNMLLTVIGAIVGVLAVVGLLLYFLVWYQ